GEVVVERIGEGRCPHMRRPVPATGETDAVALGGGRGAGGRASLLFAGVERRIDVDQRNRLRRDRRQRHEGVGKLDPVPDFPSCDAGYEKTSAAWAAARESEFTRPGSRSRCCCNETFLHTYMLNMHVRPTT